MPERSGSAGPKLLTLSFSETILRDMSTITTTEDGYTIERLEVGTAYPKNGNLSNPTKRYRWEVRHHGRRVGTTVRKAGAVDLIAVHRQERTR